jgi:hypothetical protein
MIGSEEQNGPTCFTSLPAYARRLGSESALPIVPTGTTLSARGLKFQAPHSFFDAVAAILFEASVNAAPPSLRATPPLAMPRCLAIFRPPARKLDHVLARTRSECAASSRAVRASPSPHRLTRPFISGSPD